MAEAARRIGRDIDAKRPVDAVVDLAADALGGLSGGIQASRALVGDRVNVAAGNKRVGPLRDIIRAAADRLRHGDGVDRGDFVVTAPPDGRKQPTRRHDHQRQRPQAPPERTLPSRNPPAPRPEQSDVGERHEMDHLPTVIRPGHALQAAREMLCDSPSLVAGVITIRIIIIVAVICIFFERGVGIDFGRVGMIELEVDGSTRSNHATLLPHDLWQDLFGHEFFRQTASTNVVTDDGARAN